MNSTTQESQKVPPTSEIREDGQFPRDKESDRKKLLADITSAIVQHAETRDQSARTTAATSEKATASTTDTTELDSLVHAYKKKIEEGAGLRRRTTQLFIEQGQLLVRMKALLGYGRWNSWLAENSIELLGVKPRMARYQIALAEFVAEKPGDLQLIADLWPTAALQKAGILKKPLTSTEISDDPLHETPDELPAEICTGVPIFTEPLAETPTEPSVETTIKTPATENTATENTATENTATENTATENTATENTATENTATKNTTKQNAGSRSKGPVKKKSPPGKPDVQEKPADGSFYCVLSEEWQSQLAALVSDERGFTKYLRKGLVLKLGGGGKRA